MHVWRCDLAAVRDNLQHLEPVLSRDERDRAARFVFKADRVRAIGARAVLRLLLARYLDCSPEGLTFRYGASGKPSLDGAVSQDLEFSLSHSKDVTVYAVARGAAVGIDVEHVTSDIDCDAIAAHCFAAAERGDLAARRGQAKTRAFFTCWTRKEAYVKARGAGLSEPLDGFSVAPLAPTTGPAATIHDSAGALWTVYDLDVGDHYAAALAIAGRAGEIVAYTWDWAQRSG